MSEERFGLILAALERVQCQTDKIPAIDAKIEAHLAEHRGEDRASARAASRAGQVAKWVGLSVTVLSAMAAAVLFVVSRLGGA